MNNYQNNFYGNYILIINLPELKPVNTSETIQFQKPKQREHLFDNLKFLLIALVVFGHFIEHYTSQALALRAIFVCIYLFHMPLFVFISGYFTKSENSLKLENNIKQLLIPYILFSVLWYILESRHSGKFYIDLFNPPFHLWYLLSLFFWRLLLPVVKLIRFYLLLSIIVAVGIGFNQNINHYLSLSRTISLFPFFILGNICTRESLAFIHNKKIFSVLAMALITAGTYYIFKVNPPNISLLFWDSSYYYSGYIPVLAALARLILFVAAVLLSAGFITVVPEKEYFFTRYGTRTLPIFILHAFFFRLLHKMFSTLEPKYIVQCGDCSVPVFTDFSFGAARC